jgi:hypothetical protein
VILENQFLFRLKPKKLSKPHNSKYSPMIRLTSIVALCVIVPAVILPNTNKSSAQLPMEQPDLTIDGTTRTQLIEDILKNLNQHYVFPEVAQKMEQSIKERLQRKEYDGITSATTFAETLTSHLQAISNDKHLRVRYSNQPIPLREEQSEPSPQELEEFRRFGISVNFGFQKVERLDGNIGYLDLRGFFPAELAAETAVAAMNLLANTDALIIDLRQNGGGDPRMVALLTSYLFDAEPVHLNDLYWRTGDRTQQFWTLPYVPGKRYVDKDVYVLTSKQTFSGAEEFTYNLKNLKRATIIGESTGGGAHPGGVFRINEHFQIFIPTGRAINPITKTNWEGTGVKPDIEVAAELALKTAHLAAMKKVLEKNPDERLAEELKKSIETVHKELDELQKN